MPAKYRACLCPSVFQSILEVLHWYQNAEVPSWSHSPCHRPPKPTPNAHHHVHGACTGPAGGLAVASEPDYISGYPSSSPCGSYRLPACHLHQNRASR